MIYHANEFTDKFEIRKMIGIDERTWIDLERIVICIGIFK